jgi:hypothetical protein
MADLEVDAMRERERERERKGCGGLWRGCPLGRKKKEKKEKCFCH